MTITRKCMICGKINSMEFDDMEVIRWQAGMLIQDAMPNKSIEEREFAISGMCVQCQKVFFSADEE